MFDVFEPGIVKPASACAEFHQDSIRRTAHALWVRVRPLRDPHSPRQLALLITTSVLAIEYFAAALGEPQRGSCRHGDVNPQLAAQ